MSCEASIFRTRCLKNSLALCVQCHRQCCAEKMESEHWWRRERSTCSFTDRHQNTLLNTVISLGQVFQRSVTFRTTSLSSAFRTRRIILEETESSAIELSRDFTDDDEQQCSDITTRTSSSFSLHSLLARNLVFSRYVIEDEPHYGYERQSLVLLDGIEQWPPSLSFSSRIETHAGSLLARVGLVRGGLAHSHHCHLHPVLVGLFGYRWISCRFVRSRDFSSTGTIFQAFGVRVPSPMKAFRTSTSLNRRISPI